MDTLDATCFWAHDGAMTLEERAYRSLRDAITSGSLPPGARLVGLDLAHRLGVSRTTTTNAIKRLATEGLVVYRPHADARVSSLDETTLAEVFRIRHALEGVMMSEATMRIDDTVLAELASINRGIAESIARGQPDVYRRLERDYHMRIYAAADMPMLATMLTELWNRLEPYRGRRYSGNALLESTLREHDEIELALAARDEQAAIAAMQRHVQTGHNQIAAALRQEATDRAVTRRPPALPRKGASPSKPATRLPPGSLRTAFEPGRDHRRRQGRIFPHSSLLAMTTCAVLCGARSRYAVTRWGQRCHPEIRVALGLPRTHGPSVATVHRVLSQVDHDRFAHDLRTWLDRCGIAPHQIPATPTGTPAIFGVHGEQMPGVQLLAPLAAGIREADVTSGTVSATLRSHIRKIPAMMLAGNQHPAEMQLAIMELHRSIVEQDAGTCGSH